MIDAPDLDTALARSLHEQGLVPLVTLKAMLEEARGDRERSLARRLVQQGLLPEATIQGVLGSLVTTSEAPPANEPVGESLGPYVLEEKLGAGGMGVVHRARHPETGARYAVKSFKPANLEDLERFERETAAMTAVDGHPNVVRVHASGSEGGRAYVVMELADGGELRTRLHAGALPPREAVELVIAIASGVEHLHAQGVLHRDIKPANVLFDAAGTPKLVDFGLARFLDRESLTRTGEVLGTPSHMAPEQALGDKARIGPRTDVYGLGALLYHCLTGRPPASGANVLAVLNAVVLTDPPRPSQHNPAGDAGLDRVVMRALAKRPEGRHADVAALRAELAAYLRGESLRGGPSPLALLVAVGALIVVVALGVLASTTPATEPSAAASASPTPSELPQPTRTATPTPTPPPAREGTRKPPPSTATGWHGWHLVHAGPAAQRAGCEMAYLPPEKTVLLLGGRVATRRSSSDLFAWDHQARRWRGLGVSALAAQRRTHFGLVAHLGRGSLVIAGGSKSADEHRSSVQEWTSKGWDVETRWPPLPKVRRGLQLAYDPHKELVYAFGGRTSNQRLTNRLLVSDGKSWRPVAVPAPLPSPREDFAMTFDTGRKRLVVFGGVGVDRLGRRKVLGDLWEFDGRRWVEQVILRRRPMRRRGAVLVDLQNGHTLLLGGTPAVDRSGPALGDVWMRARGHWNRLQFVTGPRPRWSAAAAWDPRRKVLVLAGGADSKGFTGDTWELRGLSVLFAFPKLGVDMALGRIPRKGETLLENFRYARLGNLTQRHGKAARYLDVALAFPGAKEHPLAPLMYLNLGIALKKYPKRLGHAAGALTLALRLAPDLLEARRLRGETNRLRGKLQMALADLETYLARVPSPHVEYDRARTLRSLGRIDEATRVLVRLRAELDPRDPLADDVRQRLTELGR